VDGCLLSFHASTLFRRHSNLHFLTAASEPPILCSSAQNKWGGDDMFTDDIDNFSIVKTVLKSAVQRLQGAVTVL
jgi:hypothetical protein